MGAFGKFFGNPHPVPPQTIRPVLNRRIGDAMQYIPDEGDSITLSHGAGRILRFCLNSLTFRIRIQSFDESFCG